MGNKCTPVFQLIKIKLSGAIKNPKQHPGGLNFEKYQSDSTPLRRGLFKIMN